MKINYNVRHLDYRDRIRNLDVVAQGQVKSNKFFPVFQIDGKEKIFKPLSKTKPLTTPYFLLIVKWYGQRFCMIFLIQQLLFMNLPL